MAEYLQNIYSMFGSNNINNVMNLRTLAKSDLLQIGNHLTGILSDKKINMDPPQLVVVGLQSSGKSSLLNRIIEMDILPTGKTMVTRTPLNLQLINSDKNCAEFGEYIDGLWKVSKKIDIINATDQNPSITAIREEIEQMTIKKAGQGQGISHNPIILKIYASYLPNLSMIDLPGLTSVACIDKGQPSDIKDQLKKMIGSYIKSERSIILLVMGARSDLEVDQAFDLVKEYDPNGMRTIGVITKIDLMNNGTDISDYLNNYNISKSLQLNYGYYAIKNKGPEQKDQSLSPKQICDLEQNYFKSHPIYSRMLNTNRLGITSLINNLTQILTEHIKNALPDILNEIYLLETTVNRSLQEIGSYIPEKEINQSTLVHTLIDTFRREFISALEDRGNALNYGRHIKDIFIEFRQTIGKMIYNFTDELIAEAMTNCDGNHMLSLPSIEVLEYCLKKTPQNKGTSHISDGPINIFCSPSLQCLEKINQLSIKLIDEIIKKPGITRFPNLTATIKKEIINGILRVRQESCSQQIKNLIKIEENYIWTDDHKFLDDLHKLYQNVKPNKIDNNIIRSLINSYFETVKRNLMDRVPKEIMYHFISLIENDINDILFEKIIKSTTISKLIEESPAIADKRKKLTEQKAQLTVIKNMIELYK